MAELILIVFMLVIFVLVIAGTVGLMAASLSMVSQRVVAALALPIPKTKSSPGVSQVLVSSVGKFSVSWGEIVCGLVIYTSSIADIYQNGVNNSPWLPLMVGVLSVISVLAGIRLRFRGMLILGSAFLLVSITTMIW